MEHENNIYQRVCRLFGKKPPNQDEETSIHYGVIPSGALMPEALEDIYSNGTDLNFESAREDMLQIVSALASRLMEDQEVKNSQGEAKKSRVLSLLQEALSDFLSSRFDWESLSDTVLSALENQETAENLSESLWSDIESDWSDDYSMGACEPSSYRYEADGYILELGSDGDIFVVKSPYFTICRECSPCAPNAGYLTSQGGGTDAYALGSDWFEDHKLPYRLWSVATARPVIPIAFYRITIPWNVRKAQNIPADFQNHHTTRDGAYSYARAHGLTEFYIAEDCTDQEVFEMEAEAYWQSRQGDEQE